MEAARLVANVNRLKYPPTVYASGWIYGMWYCGTSFQKAIYYGQYPSTFVKRIETMFEDAKMLHLCCGRCHIEGALNVDIHALPEADLVANVENLPLPDGGYDVILIDPPYTQQDSDRYKSGRLVNARAVMREASRLLTDGGWLLWLDEKYPSYKRTDWAIKGLIGICTGFERRMRVLSMFQKV